MMNTKNLGEVFLQGPVAKLHTHIGAENRPSNGMIEVALDDVSIQV